MFSSLCIKHESVLYVVAVFPRNTKIPVFLGLSVAVVLRNTKIPVFLGLSESCVYLILFYVAVVLRNTKIPFFLGLSEGCVYLISFFVAVFLRNTKIPVSLICLIHYNLHVKQCIRCFFLQKCSMIGATLSITSLMQHIVSFGDRVCSYFNAK
jgi:hypothetical protein